MKPAPAPAPPAPPAGGNRNNPWLRRRSLDRPLPRSSAPASFSSSSSTQLQSITSQVNFSDLERIKRIGFGSGGTVYKVLHRPSGKLYALKVIYGNHEDSVRRQILRELEILRDVDSPSVVKCHDMFDHNGEIQVLLEYMDGGSLEGTRIHDEPSLSDFSRQILSGLYYLHRHRIVHRDIKPSNLLINSRKQVKIADFGVSGVLSQTMDPVNSSAGTIGYMSPERIDTDLNHGKYDGYAGDIWSLGVSILEFYLGRFPFAVGRQGDWASLMCAICLSQPPEAPPTASREFRDFIACCLQRDPAKRWTAPQLLSHPFILQNAGAANNQNNQRGNFGRTLWNSSPVDIDDEDKGKRVGSASNSSSSAIVLEEEGSEEEKVEVEVGRKRNSNKIFGFSVLDSDPLVTRKFFPLDESEVGTASDEREAANFPRAHWVGEPVGGGGGVGGPPTKKSHRGPRSRSSQYRGVTFYRRTGRWESHIWDCGKQVYLGF